MTRIHYQSPDQRFGVSLPADMMTRIRRVCHRAGTREVGGILIGYYANGNHWAIVTQASEPPRNSRAGPRSFQRGTSGLQSWLDRLWGRGRYYLGEWHFHPFASPQPSDQDITQMVAFANSPQFACPEPILLIVGGDPQALLQSSATVFPRLEKPIALTPIEA